MQVEELIKLKHNKLSNFVRKHVSDPYYAEEITQEAEINAALGWAAFRGDSKPETWLIGIAVNLIKNYRTKSKKYGGVFINDPALDLAGFPGDSDDEPDSIASYNQTVQAWSSHVDTLTPKLRSCVALAAQGLTHGDIAIVEGVPEGTIKSRLSRAREALRHV